MMLLVFTLDDRQCALDIAVVERVYRAVAVTALPAAPEIVLGIVDIRGSILPVLDIRQRFRLPPKTLTPDDRLIVAYAGHRRVALVADSLRGVVTYDGAQIVAADAIASGLEHLDGVVKTGQGLLLVHDLNRFLSLDEETLLDQALENN